MLSLKYKIQQSLLQFLQSQKKMDKKIVILLLFALAVQLTHSEVQRIQLPAISKTTQNRLNLQINLLRLILPTYNWIGCNKQLLYNVVSATSQILHNATEEMKLGPGNYVQGNRIVVGGQGNIVIGNNDRVIGTNNWCFTSDYSTAASQIQEGILAVSNYKIVLSSVKQILKDPKRAISELRPEQYQMLRKKNAKMSYFFST